MAFVLAGLGILVSLYLVWYAVYRGGTTSIVSVAKVNGVCPTGYPTVVSKTVCSGPVTVNTEAVWIQFGLVLGTSSLLAVFAGLRKRVGVVFMGLFEGLATGTFGLPYLLFGIWVLWRAWRLQRYGDATFSGSSRIRREELQAQREGRASTITPAAPAVVVDPERPRPAAEPSKRYTPKKSTKRR